MRGNYSPMNLNVLGSFLVNSGLKVDAKATAYLGTSSDYTSYTAGTLVGGNILSIISGVINQAFQHLGGDAGHQISVTVYENLIHIGRDSIPLLGLTNPTTYTLDTYAAETASYGFLRLPAQQIHDSFLVNTSNYGNFFSTLSSCISFQNRSNKVIRSLVKSADFLAGIYSNMNDLVTADITGVTLSTFFWGTDLVASGRAIDLESIDSFGNPVNLLRTLKKNNALSKAVNLALVAAGFTATELELLHSGGEATIEQQKRLFGAFCFIMDQDLVDVLLPLNCQTPNLDTLADLLDPKKLFPNSYLSLTVPEYNSIPLPTNSKTYHLIYKGTDVDVKPGLELGERLRNVLPESLAYACDAFSYSMMQIKNIKRMNIEKFSQVAMHLENVSDLAIDSTHIPTDMTTASAAFDTVAKGSATDGQYNTMDFFGVLTNTVYPWKELQDIIQAYSTVEGISDLANIYSAMSTYILSNPNGPFPQLQTYINQANAAIAAIKNANLPLANYANEVYNRIGTQFQIEQTARTLALGDISSLASGPSEIYSFIDVLGQYALDTEQYQSAELLEAIADLDTLGGRSLIGSMRESRNAHRLGLTGLILDNDVDYEALRIPKPTGTKPNAETTLASNTSAGQLADIAIVTGAPTTPGSLGGSPEVNLMPDNLNLFNMATSASVIPPAEAVHQVTLCNCDCWDLLNHN